MARSSFPKISVVIPNYNHASALGNAMESVCCQDPPPYELYVFDDCSTDNSLEVVDSFAPKVSVRPPASVPSEIVGDGANMLEFGRFENAASGPLMADPQRTTHDGFVTLWRPHCRGVADRRQTEEDVFMRVIWKKTVDH